MKRPSSVLCGIRSRYAPCHIWSVTFKCCWSSYLRDFRFANNRCVKVIIIYLMIDYGCDPWHEKSRRRHIRLAIKPRYLGNHATQIKSLMELYQEVMVILSESVMKKGVHRPMAEDWQWPHIWLAIKPYFLESIHRIELIRVLNLGLTITSSSRPWSLWYLH